MFMSGAGGIPLSGRNILGHSRVATANLPNDQRIQPPADRHNMSAAAESGAKITPDMARRLRALDPEALGLFYSLYFDRVHGYVRRMVSDEHTAEDVTQDIFMHIQRALQSYDPARDLDPWVFTIASNKLRDHWRSRRHREGMRETLILRYFEGLSFEDIAGMLDRNEAAVRKRYSRALEELRRSLQKTLDGAGGRP